MSKPNKQLVKLKNQKIFVNDLINFILKSSKFKYYLGEFTIFSFENFHKIKYSIVVINKELSFNEFRNKICQQSGLENCYYCKDNISEKIKCPCDCHQKKYKFCLQPSYNF